MAGRQSNVGGRLVALVLALLYQWSSSQGAPPCAIEGKIYNDTAMSSHPTLFFREAGSCQTSCQITPTCNYWVWKGEGDMVEFIPPGGCWLLGGNLLLEDANSSSTVSGPKYCPSTTGPPSEAWGYAHPKQWSRIKGDEACGGRGESPVALNSNMLREGTGSMPANIATNAFFAAIDYKPFYGAELKNNGHAWIVEGNFGTLTLPDGVYEGSQFHFHQPSEHTVDGKRYDAELHIVHKRKHDEHLAVIGILLENKALLEDALGFHSAPDSADVALPALLSAPVNLHALDSVLKGPYFHYQGSLTTPPCSPVVHWYVMSESAAISPRLLRSLQRDFPGGNNRPLQPLSRRPVAGSQLELKHEFSGLFAADAGAAKDLGLGRSGGLAAGAVGGAVAVAVPAAALLGFWAGTRWRREPVAARSAPLQEHEDALLSA